MRRALLILLSAWSAGAQLLTTKLHVDLQAGVGITQSGGYISVWADQADLLDNDSITNDAVQDISAKQPQIFTDYDGRPAVKFDYPVLTGGTVATNTLNLTNIYGSFTTRSLTVYWVGTGNQVTPSFWVYRPTNLTVATAFFSGGSSFSRRLNMGSRDSSVLTSLNRSVYVFVGSSTNVSMWWNFQHQEGTALTSAPLTNGWIGGVGSGSALCNRYLLYATNHTWAQIQQNVAYLVGAYGVRTNYTGILSAAGDSISEGSGATNLNCWPPLLARRYPEYLWFNYSEVGNQIGTNTSSGELWDLGPGKFDVVLTNQFVTNAMVGTARSHLLTYAGINDMVSGALDGQITYQRLTNYTHTRKLAGWNRVSVSTVNAFSSPGSANWTKGSNYNLRLRSQDATWWDGLADPGIASPHDSRLIDSAVGTYYDDTIHPNNAGYGVLARHIQELINARRRGL